MSKLTTGSEDWFSLVNYTRGHANERVSERVKASSREVKLSIGHKLGVAEERCRTTEGRG